MIRNYFKISIRNVFKNKVFSCINILGLAMSLSLGLLVIQIITAFYSRDRFHENRDHIYRVTTHVKENNRDRATELATAPMPLGDVLKGYPEVEKVVRIKKNFSGGAVHHDQLVEVGGYYADQGFFEVFGFELEKGDPSAVLDQPFTVVLTYELAEKFYPHQNPIGIHHFAMSLAVVFLLAVAVILSQTIRAANRDPVETLRYE